MKVKLGYLAFLCLLGGLAVWQMRPAGDLEIASHTKPHSSDPTTSQPLQQLRDHTSIELTQFGGNESNQLREELVLAELVDILRSVDGEVAVNRLSCEGQRCSVHLGSASRDALAKIGANLESGRLGDQLGDAVTVLPVTKKDGAWELAFEF